MTHEQMIAWLTLEGWEYTGADDLAYRGVVRQSTMCRIYDNHGSITRNANGAKRHHVEGIRSWDEAEAALVRRLYDFIVKEKDHGELE